MNFYDAWDKAVLGQKIFYIDIFGDKPFFVTKVSNIDDITWQYTDEEAYNVDNYHNYTEKDHKTISFSYLLENFWELDTASKCVAKDCTRYLWVEETIDGEFIPSAEVFETEDDAFDDAQGMGCDLDYVTVVPFTI